MGAGNATGVGGLGGEKRLDPDDSLYVRDLMPFYFLRKSPKELVLSFLFHDLISNRT